MSATISGLIPYSPLPSHPLPSLAPSYILHPTFPYSTLPYPSPLLSHTLVFLCCFNAFFDISRPLHITSIPQNSKQFENIRRNSKCKYTNPINVWLWRKKLTLKVNTSGQPDCWYDEIYGEKNIEALVKTFSDENVHYCVIKIVIN